VGGKVRVQDNRGAAITITANRIAKELACRDNEPPPVSAGNTAERYEGQCRA